MIYAIMETEKNKSLYIHAAENMQEYITSSFNPDNVLWIIDTNKPPKGKTYNIKKSRLQSKAYNYKSILETNKQLKCYCCIDNIADYFHKYGKKYGLLREFQALNII